MSEYERHQNDLRKMFYDDCIAKRKRTIMKIRELADEIDIISKRGKVAKATGLGAAVAGTVIGAPIAIGSILLTGGLAAIPLVAAGIAGGAGAAGGAVAVGANIGSNVLIKSKYEDALDAIKDDRDVLAGSYDAVNKYHIAYSTFNTIASVLAFPAGIVSVVENAMDVNRGDEHELAVELRRVADVLEKNLPTLKGALNYL